jgi:DNA-binding transcriptional LysR family regulator
MLDLRQLHYFVVVVEEGQMTRAAARLHIAQPALSQAIAKLEGELGVRLFERHSRGVTPTEPGQAFFERAARALIAVEEAEDALDPWLQAAPRLVLGFPEAAGDLARVLIRRLLREHPDIDIETRHLQHGERLTEIKRGHIDAEIAYPAVGDEQLVEHTIARSRRFVLVTEDHALAGESALTFEQIEHETLPGCHPSVDARWAADAWLMKYRSAPPRLSAETPISLDELWAVVSRGRAIVILPQFMVARLQGDGLRAIPLLGVDPLAVSLLVARGDARPVIRALRATVEQMAREAELHAGLDGAVYAPAEPAPVPAAQLRG